MIARMTRTRETHAAWNSGVISTDNLLIDAEEVGEILGRPANTLGLSDR